MEKAADIIETAEMPLFEELIVTDDTPDNMLIVEEPHIEEGKEEKEFDFDTNRDFKKFLGYLDKYIEKIPSHSGKTTAGCERGIAHCNSGDKLISKVVALDMDSEIDDQEVEKRRKQLRKMRKQLEKRHKEINDAYDADDDKYASSTTDSLVKDGQVKKYVCSKCDPPKSFDSEGYYVRHVTLEHGAVGLVDDKQASQCECSIKKNAAPEDGNCPKCKIKLWQASEGLFECIACDEVFSKQITKEAGTPKLTLVMSPFERAITGAIVNGMVSQGKNAEEIYSELKKKYKFSDRDELSIQQILADMGYPAMLLKDRGHLGDSSEQLNKGLGIEFSTQYSA